MKKLLTLLTTIMMVCCCLFAACSMPGGGGGDDTERQEQANIYKDVAVQALGKVGISLQPEQRGNSGFSVTIPDKKVLTTDENAIHNIKFNAKDTAGTMWLLGMLYENEAYVVVNGLAKFDTTYSAPAMSPDGQIVNQTINQSLCLKSNIDKDNNKVYFEAMVSWPQMMPGNYGYTIGEFTYNFTTSTLIDCRYIMATHTNDYVDMMLTEDGSYLWYETETPDEFTLAVDSAMNAFNAECDAIDKLTGNFNAELQAYVDDLASATTNSNPSQPGEGGGEGGNGGNEGGGQVGEGTKPTNPPMQPTYVQVDQATWDTCLALDQLPDYCLEIMWNNDSVGYTVDGDFISVRERRESLVSSEKAYFKRDETYYCSITNYIDGSHSEGEITESEYNEVLAKARVDYSQYFEYASFTYDSDRNCYYLEADADLGISEIQIKFVENALYSISFLKDGTMYDMILSFIKYS